MFVSTSRFRQSPGEIYSGAASIRLPYPTSYTPAIVAAAEALLEHVFRRGFVYHKEGLFLIDIMPDSERQQSLTDGIDDERRARLMAAVDRMSGKHDTRTVRPLATGGEHRREMRRARLSGRYTTRLDEVLTVKAS